MPLIASLAAVAGFAGLAFASPVEKIEKRAANTFRINEVQAGKSLKVGALAMQKAYLKYGKAVPPEVAAAVSKITGSVIANPEQYDVEYLCPVSVGANTLHLDFDTGSADLWVYSDLLPAGQQGSHPLYQTSGGSQMDGQSWSISYADGSGASGLVYADTVVIGEATATSQAVEAATSVSAQFQGDPDNDGLVGLSFSSLNRVTPNMVPTFFDTVRSSLDQALFAADLKKGEPGSYDFGFIDESKYVGDLVYTSVDSSQGFWMITADAYYINDLVVVGPISGIADTGTTLLLLDDSIVSTYWGMVSGATNDASQGGYVFPCDATLPDFAVSFGGQIRNVPGSYLNFAPAADNNCFGGLQSNSGLGFSIFGDIFLKSQYVVFDQTQDSPRIGLGQQQ